MSGTLTRVPPAMPSAPGAPMDDRDVANGTSSEPLASAAQVSQDAPPPWPWSGRTGRIGYVAKMFPRISETFILDEILALKRIGAPVRIYSELPATRDGRVHPVALELAADVEVLSPEGRPRVSTVVREFAACFRARPLRMTLYLVRALTSAAPGRRLRRLREAAHLACCLRRDCIVHVHAAWAHTPATVVRMAHRLSGIPWSMSAHAKDIHLSDERGLAQKLASARFTVACTAAHRELLAGLETPPLLGEPRSRVSLAHHGVDATFFAPNPAAAAVRDRGTPVVLSIGRMVPKKGFPVLLEAAAQVARRGIPFQLEIVGGGPEREHIEHLIETLGLQRQVVLSGVAVREEIRAAYQRATCFVLACRIAEDGDRDGIPNTLAEAMASGLPVISTRLPGVEEIVTDGRTGCLVAPDDPAALAEALARVLTDPELRHALGSRAREWIVEHFDARTNGDRRACRLARTLGIERVLYISADRGIPVRGHKGASVHVRSVVAALVRAGVDTRILTTHGGPGDGVAPRAPLFEAATGERVRALVKAVARLPGAGEPFKRAVLRLLDNLPLRATGRRLAAGWKPDLVYERYALTAFAGAALASRLRVPFVLEINAPLTEEEQAFRGLRLGLLARWTERWLLRRADAVVVVSESLREWAVAHGARRERVLMLPNAVDPGTFDPREDGAAVRRRYGLDGEFVVGFCGSLKPWHGVAGLLDAVAGATREQPRLQVLVIGDGPERDALEHRASALGIAPRVHFTSSLPHAEVASHLAACDLFAAPYEPMERFYFSPLKVAEYLQMGRPVLASAVGDLPRLASGAPQLVLLPPGDTAAWTRAILAHAGGSAAASRAAAAGPVWTWDDVACAVLERGERLRRQRWGWNEADAAAIEPAHVPLTGGPAPRT